MDFGFPLDDIPSMVTTVEKANGYELMYMVDMLSMECSDDKEHNGFFNNRGIIAEHLNQGTLYVLRFDFDMYRDRFIGDCRGWCDETMPAFCAMNSDGTIDILWVHKDARRKGLGTKFVKHFEVKHVLEMLPASEPFWKKMGVTAEDA